MAENFWVYVDRGGKMPQLRRRAWSCPTHPYYVRYVGNRAVAYHGEADALAQNLAGDSVWCHSRNCFVPLSSLKQE